MRSPLFAPMLAIALASPAYAHAAALQPALAGLDFLVGTWFSGSGKVAETGETATGSSRITIEAGGAVLLRKDHTDLFTKAGKPSSSFDQIMMIYPDNGAIHADYADGSHVIHYSSAEIQPGHMVVFSTSAQPGIPSFKLAYTLSAPSTLTVAFSMAPPGSTGFNPIASGTLAKRR